MIPLDRPVRVFYDLATVANALTPSITLPMHYKSEKTSFPLSPVEDFTKGKARVRKVGGPEIEVTFDSLPKEPEIVLLQFSN
jgi:hypothetical protein